jgi:hypothetical protein
MQGQNTDGTLQPPKAHETTDVSVKDLAEQQGKPVQQTQGIKMLTMDEADSLRAERAFLLSYDPSDSDLKTMYCLKKVAHELSRMIINKCPASKERSQALGNVQQVVMWAHEALKNRPS